MDETTPHEATPHEAPTRSGGPGSDHEVRWCFHATAFVHDYDLTVARLGALFGLVPLEENSVLDPAVGRRGGMAWIGDGSIEIGESIVDDGAVDRFIKRFGPGHHSFGVQVRDLDVTMAHLDGLGVSTVARPEPFFCFTDPRATEGLLLEWCDGELDIDPHFGAELPDTATEPLLPVDTMAFIGAAMPDPHASASKLADLFGTAVTFTADDGTGPVTGVSLGDCTLAIWPSDERARLTTLGLRTPSLDAAGIALDSAGVQWNRLPDRIDIDPRGTGGVPICLVESLLEGDPRA